MAFITRLEPPPRTIEEFSPEWKEWLWRLSIVSNRYINPDFISATSITKTHGGTQTGTVTDLQTFNDGNVVQIVEAASAPGYRLEINFTKVAEIFGIISYIRYTGSASHDVSLQVRDYTNSADLDLLKIDHTASLYQYRTVLLPDDDDFIDSSGNAQIIIDHETTGNVTHDLYVHYVALLGQRR